MIASLFFKDSPNLTFDWIDGPNKEECFQYEDGMPIIQPGLYSGVYHDMYGKFKREILLIQYTTYNKNNLEKIQKEVFNKGIHNDADHIYDDFCQHVVAPVENANVASGMTDSVVVVTGRKVTGDLHVPSGELTFGALVHPQVTLTNTGRAECPETVIDRGGKHLEYRVLRHWDGWGTLAFENFRNPSWSIGTLLQLTGDYRGTGDHRDSFGFRWGQGNSTTSVLKRMAEQDMFEWFG
jgi:hypothetical protein